MAVNKLAIKTRIRSVESTSKITKAMQLVAASKLKRQKDHMEKNREYAYYFKETVSEILPTIKFSNHPFLKANSEGKPLTIVFTSDMGLCGGYNANVYRMVQDEIGEDDPIIMVGSRGEGWIHHRSFHVIKTVTGMDDNDYGMIASLADEALAMFSRQEIASIRILYTHFKNAVTFEPQLVTLLPIEMEKKEQQVTRDTIFEPEGDKILDTLVPMYVRSLLFSYYLETKTSEQASRRTAMETATDNADELRSTLELQYNQARQAAITQEITEIVGGANALE